MKKKLLLILSCIFMVSYPVYAQQSSLEIIPGVSRWDSPAEIVETIGSSGWHVRDQYKKYTQSEDLSLWEQFATGVMTWDTLLDYSAYIFQFLSQLALLVWAVMIIFFGYKYAIGKGTMSALRKLILWILVVIFAYVIVRTIWYMFIA